MAFRASSAIPTEQYHRAKQQAVQLKNYSAAQSLQIASGSSAAVVFAILDNVKALRERLGAIASTPGIAAYAQSQEDDPAYDVAAEFTAMLAAADAVITEIVTTLPTDAQGWLLTWKMNPDGSLDPRVFTAAQLATLRGLLDAVVASIN